ncbi:MAG: flagellar hook-length control protein FliK [Synergistaceae bacterium]|jgi:flagellar hook-length control protein FliK|nr:flagellar hook-length control protein FliK [Synergistaceae bacterium]
MQNVFLISTTASPSQKSAAEFGPKSGTDGREAGETDVFSSFLATLTQAVDQADTDKNPASSNFLDMTFSAEQGENREEYTASLPLEGMADSPFLSKSVLDLLASLKGDLKEKGIDGGDLQLLSERVDEVLDESGGSDKSLFDLGAERLEGVLSRLRDRYATVVASDDSRHLDIEVALSDNLKLGFEASLKRRGGKEITEEITTEPDDPVKELEEDLSEDSEEETPPMNADILFSTAAALLGGAAENPGEETASRLHAYLKTDAPRPAASSKMSAKANDGEKKASSSGAAGSGIAGSGQSASVLSPNGTVSQGEVPAAEDLDSSRSENAETSSNRGVLDAQTEAKTSVKTDAKAGAAEDGAKENPAGDVRTKAGAAETKTNFQQFFDDVLSRRASSSLGAEGSEGLELAKETPLSRNEALREGLDNVVRFIRSSGEQKAALIVDPPALGRVSVELTSTATGLEASIKVGSEQVRQLVQDQIVQLRLSLAQQGVQLTHFSVDVQQDNSGHRQQDRNTGQRRQFGIPGGGEEDEEQTIFRVDLDRGLLYWVA